MQQAIPKDGGPQSVSWDQRHVGFDSFEELQ